MLSKLDYLTKQENRCWVKQAGVVSNKSVYSDAHTSDKRKRGILHANEVKNWMLPNSGDMFLVPYGIP